MTQKPNLFQDILGPILGIVAFSSLIFFFYQIWLETRFAAEADKNGPTLVSYSQRNALSEYWMKVVQICDAKAGPLYSIATDQEGRTSTAFVLFPHNQDNGLTNEDPVVIQHRRVGNAEQAEVYRADKMFAGTLKSSWALNFKHQEVLSEAYPAIDFNSCHILAAPFRRGQGGGGEAVSYTVIVIAFGFVALIGWFAYQLVNAIRNSFRHGVAIMPKSNFETATVNAPPIRVDIQRPADIDDTPAQEYAPWTETASPVSRLPSLCLFAKAAGILMGLPVLVMAGLGKGDLMPDWMKPVFMNLFYVTATAWLTYIVLLVRKLKIPGNDIRKLLPPDGLPFWQRWRFAKFDRALTTMGFSHVGDFLVKDNRPSVAREYLSADHKSLIRVLLDDDIRVIAAYSILIDGTVILTSNTELPGLHHPKIDLFTGQPGTVSETVVIHQQVVAGYGNVVVKVSSDELHAMWMYCESLELQMIGRKPREEIMIPNFRSLPTEQPLTQSALEADSTLTNADTPALGESA